MFEGGDTQFDQVEVFFGYFAGDRIPTTPLHPINFGVEKQRLFTRKYNEEDAGAARREPGNTWEYFLPATDVNRGLGDYVMAIAYLDGHPVAVGERFDFTLPDDNNTVNRYPIPLLRFENQGIERWGRDKDDCVRWERDRGADAPRLIAVVRGSDADCDGLENEHDTNADCSPLDYCALDGTTCTSVGTCFDETNGMCAAGSCVNTALDTPRSCMPAVCLDPTLCDKCDGSSYSSDTAGLLACATSSLGDGTHLDYKIAVKVDYALCMEPEDISLRLRFPCIEPKVLDWVETQPGPRFSFDIGPGGTTNVCKLLIYPPFPGAAFTSIPHLLIQVSNPASSMYPTSQFVIALEGVHDPSSPNTTCPGSDGVDITNDLQSCFGF